MLHSAIKKIRKKKKSSGSSRLKTLLSDKESLTSQAQIPFQFSSPFQRSSSLATHPIPSQYGTRCSRKLPNLLVSSIEVFLVSSGHSFLTPVSTAVTDLSQCSGLQCSLASLIPSLTLLYLWLLQPVYIPTQAHVNAKSHKPLTLVALISHTAPQLCIVVIS